MAKKNISKHIMKQVQQLVDDEALYARRVYNVKFTYHGYSTDVQTFYVWQEDDSPEPVEHYMLEDLQSKVQEINSRYRIGIMYQGEHPNDANSENE